MGAIQTKLDNTQAGLNRAPNTKEDRHPKPERLPVDFEAIPSELKALAQWILWRWKPKEKSGDWDKPPFSINGVMEDYTNPHSWSSFGAVKREYETGKWDGIGFVLTKDEPYCAVDWDDCRDADTGTVTPEVMAGIKALDSYTEVSPSGTGFKTYLRGKLPNIGHHPEGIGVFDRNRYVCITGHRVSDVSAAIEDRQTELDNFVRERWPGDFEEVKKAEGKGPTPVGRDLETLSLSLPVKALIRNGEKEGKRSEAIMSVIGALVRAGLNDPDIVAVFEAHPNGIGEKMFEKGKTAEARAKWLIPQIQRARKDAMNGKSIRDVAPRVREYLLEEFDGGVFNVRDLRRELNLDDAEYTLARQTVRRMVNASTLKKVGHALGSYRVVSKKKDKIDWSACKATSSQIILPGVLHEVVTIRNGDLIAFAAFKNHGKTALALETIRLNLEHFQIHHFITEYKERTKQRLMDFGIDFNHRNYNAYPIEESDYLSDKVETGPGVLNVIDHIPNLDNFYLVGKHQDEIHRSLNGALCLITHQKKSPENSEALGGTSWQTTPTLAVTIFLDGEGKYPARMFIRKGKEPGHGRRGANSLSRFYVLRNGCRFEYDPAGWQ